MTMCDFYWTFVACDQRVQTSLMALKIISSSIWPLNKWTKLNVIYIAPRWIFNFNSHILCIHVWFDDENSIGVMCGSLADRPNNFICCENPRWPMVMWMSAIAHWHWAGGRRTSCSVNNPTLRVLIIKCMPKWRGISFYFGMWRNVPTTSQTYGRYVYQCATVWNISNPSSLRKVENSHELRTNIFPTIAWLSDSRFFCTSMRKDRHKNILILKPNYQRFRH